MALEKGNATKKKPSAKKVTAARSISKSRKPAPAKIPTTGNTEVDRLIARIHELAGPASDAPSALPADWNPAAGREALKNFKPPKSEGGGNGMPKMGDFHSILDIMLRPVRAVQGGIYEGTRNDVPENEEEGLLHMPRFGAIGKGFVEGLTGKTHHTGRDVLAANDYTGRGAGTLGFISDVALDPLMAVPFGKIGSAGKALDRKVLGEGVLRGGRVKAAPIAAEAATKTVNPLASAIGNVGETSIPVARSAAPDVSIPRMPQGASASATDAMFPAEVMRPTLPVIQKAPKPVKPTPSTLPPPKPLSVSELPDEVKAQVLKVAESRVPALWEESGLANKVVTLGVDYTWDAIKSNPELLSRVTRRPDFKKWFAGIVNEERTKAVSQINASRLAEYHASVKSIDDAVNKSAPDVAAQLDEITPPVVAGVAQKPLNETHQSIADAAVQRHLATNGDRALTSLGQGKLRQTVANEYFKTKPNALKYKNTKNVQAAINRIYVAAEKALEEGGAQVTGRRLSEVMDKVNPNSFSSPGDIARFLDDAGIESAAKDVAADLPKAVQGSFIKSVLESLKQAGNATEVAQVQFAGKADLRFRAAEAVAKDMGLAKVPKLPLPKVQTDKVLQKTSDYASMAPEALDRAFNAAYGQTPWEHSALRMGKASVNTFKEHDITYLRKLTHGTDKPGFNAAFEAAQLGENSAKAAEISAYFDHLKQLLINAGVTEQEFVSTLKRIPQFKGMKPDGGFDAWKSMPKGEIHAAKLMALYANAAHNSTLNSITAGHLGNLFGAVKATEPELFKQAVKQGYKPVPGIPGLKDVVFPPEYLDHIKHLFTLQNAKSPEVQGFWKVYDKVQGYWKVGMTKYLPSHHITNQIGGMYMAWLDGLNDPRWYARAVSVMRHQDAAATGVGKGISKEGFTTGSGHKVSQAEMMQLFNGAGLRPSFSGIADLADDAAELKLKSAFPAAIDKASQAREVSGRLAHFMYALSTEKGPLADAVQAAAMRVQKHHADYGDLTNFERFGARRLIPFYTWQRKVAPTLLIQGAKHPAKLMAYPKLQQNINQHFGIDPEPGNPFPGESMTPDFLTEGIQAKYGTNAQGNTIWGGPRTPFDDLIGKFTNHPGGYLKDMITPALKVPYELNSGTALGNSDIRVLTDEKDKRDYVETNTPLLNILTRLTRRSPSHGFTPTQNNDDEQGTNIAALINLLTGAGLRENTERMRNIAERLEP